MSGETSDHIVVHSSIALLQERFRQLQRVKELRAERELLKLVPCVEPASCPTTTITASSTHYEPSKLFFNSELIHPQYHHRPTSCSSQVSLSLWPNSESNNYGDFKGTETSLSLYLWPRDKIFNRGSTTIFKFDKSDIDSDVDTSLHL